MQNASPQNLLLQIVDPPSKTKTQFQGLLQATTRTRTRPAWAGFKSVLWDRWMGGGWMITTKIADQEEIEIKFVKFGEDKL